MKFIRIFFLLIALPTFLLAQVPDLPSMKLVTESAQNKLSWNCQYEGVKSIAIQRSSDSVKNFVTIGIINNPKKGIHSYTDERPMIGKNNYRLYILFSGDVEWFSNNYIMSLDSATIAKSHQGVIPSGYTNANTNYENGNAGIATDFYYTPSSQIYTNPYTGHISINLKDALSKKYSIKFFDPKKNEVLRVSRVTKPTLILDRNNFNSPGTYNFQLFEGSVVVETGYITIY